MVGGQPDGEAVQIGLERALQGDALLVPLVVLHCDDQGAGRDPEQPGH